MNATATTAQVTTTYVAGDVVWGRPVREGKTLARRKGIVLGYFADDTTNLVVWWYGMGDASMETTTLMFARELTKDGDIFDQFRGRKAAQLARGCYHFERAHSVGRSLESHGRRMKSIGVL
jgi:Family of unknown function (DUF6409)